MTRRPCPGTARLPLSGDVYAEYLLGLMYGRGLGVAQDDTQEVYWFRKVADAGEPLGIYALGTMYESGAGVAKDLDQAVSWYRKAAALGDDDAKKQLRRLGK